MAQVVKQLEEPALPAIGGMCGKQQFEQQLRQTSRTSGKR
jgi:hypothetical protein